MRLSLGFLVGSLLTWGDLAYPWDTDYQVALQQPIQKFPKWMGILHGRWVEEDLERGWERVKSYP